MQDPLIWHDAITCFKKNCPLESMHEAACFIELYEYINECDIRNLLDLEEFGSLLQQQIKHIITYHTDCWSTDYVCSFERDFIKQTQTADGTWNVTWSWNEFPEQWAVSKNWRKPHIIIRNIAYIKAIES